MIKISIITVCYNSEKYIEDCINSVISQDYQNIEYIIIDGKSTDSTTNIISKYISFVSKFISEPDKGIYDAMNKGLILATGEIIGILNSDDLYIDNTVLTRVVGAFNTNKCDSLYGDLYYVSREDPSNIIRKWETKLFESGSFKWGWHPPHPTFFVKKDIYNKYGIFNLDFRLSADFELMLRFLEKQKISTCYIQGPIIRMRLGGATSKNIQNTIRQNIECYNAFKINNLKVNFLYPIFRLLPKLLQFLKK
jgi:glycosyltransferase involved in cell wall biosynthesis